jgi:superfamily II DNA or RNA helicase/regulator of sigma D
MSQPLTNYAKGIQYEYFIKFLRQSQGFKDTYLWNEVPSELLIKYDVVGNNKEYRKRRNDCGVDLVSEVDGKLYLIQCKYGYKSGLKMDDLKGYFMMTTFNRECDGIIYHTTHKISMNVLYWFNKKYHSKINVQFNQNLSIEDNVTLFHKSNDTVTAFEEEEEVVEELDASSDDDSSTNSVIIEDDEPNIPKHRLCREEQQEVFNLVESIKAKPDNHNDIIKYFTKLNHPRYDYLHTYICDSITDTEDRLTVPYYYQIEACRCAIDDFKTSDLLMLSLPCGTGKTFTSWLVAGNYSGVIIVSPLRALALQNLNAFKEYNDMYLLPKTYWLIDSDSSGTTLKEDVNKALSTENVVISTTYDSIYLFEELENYSNFLVIIDEFHNISRNVIYDDTDTFNEVLFSTNNKKLLLSATPRIYDDGDYCELNSNYKMTYKLSFNEALKSKHICDYKLFFPDFGSDGNVERIEYSCSMKKIDKDVIGKIDFLNSGFQSLGFKKCIAYFEDTKALRLFEKNYAKVRKDEWFNDVQVFVIVSGTRAKERKRIMKEFNDIPNRCIILSVRILDEGIDIVACDSIYFTYMTSNKIKIIQRLCRAIRINKFDIGKVAKILCWCDSEYNNVSELLESIREYDTEFKDKVSILSGSERSGNGCSKKSVDNKKKVGMKVIGCKEFRFQNWQNKLDAVREFIEKHDRRPNYNAKKGPSEKVLGSWLASQQTNIKTNKYAMAIKSQQVQFQKLLSDYPELFQTNEEQWTSNLCKVREFIETNNRRPSSIAKKGPSEKVLGSWLETQQKNLKSNKKSMAIKSQRFQYQKLLSDYPELFQTNEEQWTSNLCKVREFIETNNRRPSRTAKKGTSEKVLDAWLGTQQKNIKTNKYAMAIKSQRVQFQKLLSDYPELFQTNEEQWTSNLCKVREFIETNNKRPNGNAKKGPSEKVLGSWLTNQQTNLKSNKQAMAIKSQRVQFQKLLSDYPELFQTNEEQWTSNLCKVREFIETNNRRPTSVAKKGTSEKFLGMWLSNQQKNLKSNKQAMAIKSQRAQYRKLLSDYPELFQTNEELWTSNLSKVREFIETNNRRPTSVTKKETSENFLGKWLGTQKQNLKSNKASMSIKSQRSQYQKLLSDYPNIFKTG